MQGATRELLASVAQEAVDPLRSYAAQRLLPQPASGVGDDSAETEALNIFGGGQFEDFVHARQRNLTLDDLNRLRDLSFLDDQSNIYDLHHELTTLQRRVVGGQQDATAAMFCRLAVSRSDSAVIGYDRARILALACYHQRQSAPRTIVSDMTEASLLLQYNRKRHLDSVTKLVENLAAKMQQIGNVEVGSLCSSVVSSSIYLPIRTTVGKAVENREHMFDLCTGGIIDYFQIAGSFPQPSRR